MASAFPTLISMAVVPGTRVLVAGGTGTVGSAVVQAMVRQGAKVIVASRAEGRFRRLLRETPKCFHDSLVSVRGDLTKEEFVQKLYEYVHKPNKDRVKHIVACLRADMTSYEKVKMFDQSLPELYSVAREEIRCHYLLMKTFLPYLEKYSAGTSYTVVTGFPHSEVEKFGAYIPLVALANSSLQGMVKAARAEYRESKVAINEANLRCTVGKESDEELRRRGSDKIGPDLIGKAITAVAASEVRCRIVIGTREECMTLAGLPFVEDKDEGLAKKKEGAEAEDECCGRDTKMPDGRKGEEGGDGAAAVPGGPQQSKVNLVSQKCCAPVKQSAGKRAVHLFDDPPHTEKKKKEPETLEDLIQTYNTPNKEKDEKGFVPQEDIERQKQREQEASVGFFKKFFTSAESSVPPPRPGTPVVPEPGRVKLIPQNAEPAEEAPRGWSGRETPSATIFDKPARNIIRTQPLYSVPEKPSGVESPIPLESLQEKRLKAEETVQSTLSQYGIYSDPVTPAPEQIVVKKTRKAPPTTSDMLKNQAADPVSAMAANILKSGPIRSNISEENSEAARDNTFEAREALREAAGMQTAEMSAASAENKNVGVTANTSTDRSDESEASAAMREAERLLENAAEKAKIAFDKNKESLKEKLKDTVPNQVHNFVHPAFIKERPDNISKTPLPHTGKIPEVPKDATEMKDGTEHSAVTATPRPPSTQPAATPSQGPK